MTRVRNPRSSARRRWRWFWTCCQPGWCTRTMYGGGRRPSFWRHPINEELVLVLLVNYIHVHPDKYGRVGCQIDWPWSSFHRSGKYGAYPPNGGCSHRSPLNFGDMGRALAHDPISMRPIKPAPRHARNRHQKAPRYCKAISWRFWPMNEAERQGFSVGCFRKLPRRSRMRLIAMC